MKRSTQIGLAAGAVVLTAVVVSQFNKEDDIPQSPEMQACLVSGTMSRADCIAAFKEAKTRYKELQIPEAQPAGDLPNTTLSEAPQIVAPSSSAPNSSSSTHSNSNPWVREFARGIARGVAESIFDDRYDRSEYRRSSYESPSSTSSSFNRSGSPSTYERNSPAVRPATVPRVENRGGFGTTARSFSTSSSS